MVGVFVTGTDTDVGKTWISYGLVRALLAQGHSVVGMKPVASGCQLTADGLRNGDALLLQQAASVRADYSAVNPYAFEPAIAPEAAARQAGVKITPAVILDCYEQLADVADHVVVEGVGGWRVPLNGGYDVAAMAVDIDLPVVLVVAIKLGCISHARLAAESILASGLPLLGWVATAAASPAVDSVTVEALKQALPVPCLGVVPKLASPAEVAEYLSIELIQSAVI